MKICFQILKEKKLRRFSNILQSCWGKAWENTKFYLDESLSSCVKYQWSHSYLTYMYFNWIRNDVYKIRISIYKSILYVSDVDKCCIYLVIIECLLVLLRGSLVYLVDMVQPKAIGQGSVLFSGNYGCNDTLFPQAICIAIFDMYYDTYLNTFYRKL